MLDWIYGDFKNTSFNHEKKCKYAFYSFKAISDCNPELTKKLLKQPKNLEKLF